MRVGLVREIKTLENRVGLTPAGVRALVERGHQVMVEHGAGTGSGFDDAEYRQAGAALTDAAQAWAVDLVVKVKEPIEAEYRHLQQQLVFTYFHLAGVSRKLTDVLLSAGTGAIAYETLESPDGRLPLLAPMSAIAGNMAVQMGAHYLAAHHGGSGVLLGTVLDRRHGHVLIIGDGVVGTHAARAARALGAYVTVAGRGERLKGALAADVDYVISTPDTIASLVRRADLLVGAVLIRGARAARVVTTAMVRTMQRGSVIVDVSIDQGGCVETARPTTHAEPVYELHGVVHYCVANMPGAYPRTSTLALTDATLPYVLQLADRGIAALRDDAGFARALNTYQGYITCQPVAEALGPGSRYRAFPGDFAA